MKVVCLVLALACAAQAASSDDALWHKFKNLFTKSYEDRTEETLRRQVFYDNLHKIEALNKEQAGFRAEMNEFGDLTDEEFRTQRLGKIQSVGGKYHRVGAQFMFPENENAASLPQTVDWRQHGYVTPVKNQGPCGSCWSFSTTGSLEGQTFRATGKLVSLSEQNLVDCSTVEGDHGCNGGLMSDAFSYIAINGGIMSEADYPYTHVKGNCTFDSSKIAATDVSYVSIEHFNETQLMQAVATNGPVSVAIDAAVTGFRYYKSGVFYAAECSQTQLDHGVLVVGYGTENGMDYWLVKNSWGPTWGDSGYIKMSRNRSNNCGIASMASYPIV